MLKRSDKLALTIVSLGIISIILENATITGWGIIYISHALDLLISLLFISEIVIGLAKARNKVFFLKHNLIEIIFVSAFLFIFIGFKYYHFFIDGFRGHDIPVKVIIAISAFNMFKVLLRIRKLRTFFKSLTTHPAQTIMFSFLGVILIGTILLMMPLATQDMTRIGFVNALFTATSATCVTGLIVVDTATRFSDFGKTVIMLLIQSGGLGIMIFGYFTAFLVGRKLTHEDKMALSYMLEESDASKLAQGLKKIVFITLGIELAGSLLLFPAFWKSEGSWVSGIYYSVFHSISAFCNAGFALFTDSLQSFKSSPLVSLVIALLIIAGGISFIVISNTFSFLRTSFARSLLKKPQKIAKLNLNSKVVLTWTVILIITGTLFIYRIEHRPSLLNYNIGTQYLMSFFQSVTLRTAGFNTMDISKLHTATYALMILFMFIGGASASTAGGVKVNTVGVVWAYVKSIFNNKDDVVLFKSSVSRDLINQAFLVVFLSLTTIFASSFILALTENKKFIRILFEATSAFGTVGLSTGLTQELTIPGRLIITLLMFIGRLGPITIITALTQKRMRYPVEYPQGKITIG